MREEGGAPTLGLARYLRHVVPCVMGAATLQAAFLKSELHLVQTDVDLAGVKAALRR